MVFFKCGNFLKKMISCGEVSSVRIIFLIIFFLLMVSMVFSVFSVSIVVSGGFVFLYFVGWF